MDSLFNLNLTSPMLISLLLLTFFEIILGVDNLIFLAIVTERLPQQQQKRARKLGLLLALVTRILFLALIFWLIHVIQPLFSLFAINFSIRDLVMIFGGLFLLYKSTEEIHGEMSLRKPDLKSKPKYAKIALVITQIILLDIVFSFDSMFTAIGLTQNFWIISIAIWISIVLMIFASESLSQFIKQNPSIKMLALSFLLMIGTILIADGVHFYIPKTYIYFSVCFSLLVESLNTLARKRRSRIVR